MFRAQISDFISSQIMVYGPHTVLVLDNVFKNPLEIRRFGIENAADFKPPSRGFYPGVVLPVDFVDECFKELYSDVIATAFSTVSAVKAKHRLSLTCFFEKQLIESQTRPHRDIQQINRFIRNLAAVTYFFDQPELGGTSFYSEPSMDKGRLRDMKAKSGNHLGSVQMNYKSRRVGKYITGSSKDYTLDGICPAAFNRMVVFDSTKLHSGHIVSPSSLSVNIEKGRLTLNSFFSSISLKN